MPGQRHGGAQLAAEDVHRAGHPGRAGAGAAADGDANAVKDETPFDKFLTSNIHEVLKVCAAQRLVVHTGHASAEQALALAGDEPVSVIGGAAVIAAKKSGVAAAMPIVA